MRISFKMALLITSGLQMVSAPALAQTATPPEAAPAGTSPEASPATPAAEVGSQGRRAAGRGTGEGGDIIVTARRVEERLQDVPISITVFNQQQLANRNVVQPDDLALYTPSLTTSGVAGRDNTSYAIRGFTQQLQTSPSVAVYFADVVAPRSGGAIVQGDGAGPGTFFDLQNVQVLKGPQGTLFGRNTTGGAVLLVPQKPSGNFEGYVEALYGSHDWKGLNGAINVPISDTVRARIAFDLQDRDGLTENVGTGPDVDDRHFGAVRASVVWDVTPDIENYTIASYRNSRTNGSSFSLLNCNPNSFTGSFICGPFATRQASGPHTVSLDIPNPLNQQEQYGIINTTTWRASDTITIKNIFSYTRLNGRYNSDIFGTDIKIPGTVIVPVQDRTAPGGVVFFPTPTGALAGTRLQFVDVSDAPGTRATKQDNFTEELQIQGRTDGDKFIWQVGAYYERSTPNGLVGNRATQLINCTDINTLQCYSPVGQIFRRGYQLYFAQKFGAPPAFTDPGFDFPIGGVGSRTTQIEFRNLGFYGQGTYALSEKLKVTAGVRYTSDLVKSSAESISYSFPAANVAVPSCIVPGAVVANNCRINLRTTSAKPTWLIDFDFKPNDDTLLYAKYARGYRQGGIAVNGADGFQTFQPEKVDAYEIGLKTSLPRALRGNFNIDGFYNDLVNQQLGAVFVAPPGSPVTQSDGVVNAGKSRIYGAEVEANVTLFDGFNLNGSYTYLNTKLISFAPVILPANSPFATVNPTADQGGPLIYSPKHRFTATASYTLPLDQSAGSLTFAATYSYTSSFLGAALSATPSGLLPSFNTLNLNLNWNQVLGSRFDLAAFATNVTNEKYLQAISGTYRSSGFDAARYGEQRVIGVKARYNF